MLQEDGSLTRSYIVRVEGCSGFTSLQRLVFVTAGGSAVQQGEGKCTATFAEEVREGGREGGRGAWLGRRCGWLWGGRGGGAPRQPAWG